MRHNLLVSPSKGTLYGKQRSVKTFCQFHHSNSLAAKYATGCEAMRERLVQVFWRNWDASLNRWLVRYLYVPLGGREAAARNALICFLFAAILVGPDSRMLAWAGCASAAFCLELVSSGLKALACTVQLQRGACPLAW